MSKPLSPDKGTPLSIRLSASEREFLLRGAGGLPLSTYVKQQLFGGAKRGGQSAAGIASRVLLAQILGQLGASGLPASMAVLAEAAATGSLHVDDLTASRLRDVCDDIRGMRLLLMRALGKRVPDQERPERVTTQFIRVAVDTRGLS